MAGNAAARARDGTACLTGMRLLVVGVLSCVSFAVSAVQEAGGGEEKKPTDIEGVKVIGYWWGESGFGGWFHSPPVEVWDLVSVGGGGGGSRGVAKQADPEEKDPCDSSGTPAGETTSQPVDIATGTKLLYELDISAGSPNHPLLLLRSYRSTRTGQGMFGGKWSSTLEYAGVL